MKNIKKNTIIYLSFAIIFLIIILLGATYAFFATNQNINANVNVGLTLSNELYEFSSTSASPISLNITPDLMSQRSSNNTVDAANVSSNIAVTLKSPNEDMKVTCTFDFIYVWDSNDKYINGSNDKNLSSGNYPFEFSIMAGTSSNEDAYKAETDLSNLTWSNVNNKYQAKLFSASIESNNPNGVTQNYVFKNKIYNIDVAQINIMNKSFSSHIEIDKDSVNCSLGEASSTLAGTIIDAAIEESQVNSATMTKAIVHDANGDYRYIGADPDNYVTFNGETWRIIGVFNENTHGKTGEQLVKIIRKDSLGNIAWDSNYSNNWSTASLQTSLNGNTYTYASNALAEEVPWHLGGAEAFYSASNGLASHFYGYERGTAVYGDNPTEWTGKVGLMYVSDYGYASIGNSSTNRATCLAKELYDWSSMNDCTSTDWLFDSSNEQWTLVPHSGSDGGAFRVGYGGYVGNYGVYVGIALRPSLYLKAETKITGGNGTPSSPYQLSL